MWRAPRDTIIQEGLKRSENTLLGRLLRGEKTIRAHVRNRNTGNLSGLPLKSQHLLERRAARYDVCVWVCARVYNR